MINRIKLLLSIAVASAATICAEAAPSVLSLAEYSNDSTIVYPESVETDTHKMMTNWYLQNYTALDRNADMKPDVEVSDQEIIDRLKAMPTLIEMPYNSIVRAYINMYTQKKRSLVESMLGMSLYYMPIFEQALEREGLPIELKYLPVIESALDPNAVSRAGATGLWQLMLPTARGLGMEINTLVDERRDPVRSSEAATKYLKQLYDIYKDWSLAIAAYNCGPGNVNKAMRRCSEEKKDFWSIYPYLPKETRGYVPCFIAANYVMNYYNKHNISPALAKRPILTDSVHVNRRVHFQQIADILQIPVEEIQILNPQYRQQCIPGDIHEYSLILPANQIYSYIMSEDAIVAHNAEFYARRETVEPASLNSPTPAVVNGQEGEWVTTEQVKYHKVRKGETMSSIARKYGITLKSLKRANGNISKPRRGQRLKVVTTQRVFQPKPAETNPEAEDNLLVKNETVSNGNNENATDTDITGATPNDSIQQPDVTLAETDSPVASRQITGNKTENTTDSIAKDETKQTVEPKTKSSKKENTKKNNSKKNASKKKEQSKTHTVKAGESLYKIAQKNGTTVKKLQELNGIKGNKIKPGDKIRVK